MGNVSPSKCGVGRLPLVGSTAWRDLIRKLEKQLGRNLNANEKHSLLQVARNQAPRSSSDKRSGTSAARAFKVKGEVYKYTSIRVMRPSGAGKKR